MLRFDVCDHHQTFAIAIVKRALILAILIPVAWQYTDAGRVLALCLAAMTILEIYRYWRARQLNLYPWYVTFCDSLERFCNYACAPVTLIAFF